MQTGIAFIILSQIQNVNVLSLRFSIANAQNLIVCDSSNETKKKKQ